MDKIKFITGLSKFEGLSLREISRRTGHHFNTVKKYIDKDDWNTEIKHKRNMPSLLDPLKPIIDQWLMEDIKAPRKQRHTARRIYDRLRAEYPKLLKVKPRIVQYYVARKKRELYSDKGKGYIPLSHPAGEAQADFGEFTYIDEDGNHEKGYNLTLSFPYSNAGYCQSFKGQNQECLLQGLKNIFEHIGRVPTKIWFDNLSAAVTGITKEKERRLVEQFERFSLHYGFSYNFCNPNSGHEKGSVENKVGYERRNFMVPVPCISDFEEFNIQLFTLCNADNNREHYNNGSAISDMFEDDIRAMKDLPGKDFTIGRLVKAKANKYGKVSYETNTYSASPSVALSEVWLEIGADSLKILTGDYEHISTHKRLYGKNKESMIWEPYLTLMIKRPNALKYTEFYKDLPYVWREYFDMSGYSEKREGLKVLSYILKDSDINKAIETLEYTLKMGVRDADSILASYKRMVSSTSEMYDLKLPDYIPEIKPYSPDIKVYDSLYMRRSAQ